MKLPLNNLSYPVRILIGEFSGSGFLISYKKIVYLVTARHVIYQQDTITKNFIPYADKFKILCYTFTDNNIQRTPRIYEVDFNAFFGNQNIKTNNRADLVIVKLGTLNEKLELMFTPGVKKINDVSGALVHYVMSNSRKFDEVEITNDIFVLGYPSSLSTPEMKQIDYDSPLVRGGIVAGKNYGNKTLILDCPAYGGNSGGLVLEINMELGKIHLIGVVTEFVPFIDRWRNVRFPNLYNTNLQNSGYSVAIPVDCIYDLISDLKASSAPEIPPTA
jgi:hypothetical protein